MFPASLALLSTASDLLMFRAGQINKMQLPSLQQLITIHRDLHVYGDGEYSVLAA